MKKYYTKTTINRALHVMECPNCGKIHASASERKLLPSFIACDCDEPERNRPFEEFAISKIKRQ